MRSDGYTSLKAALFDYLRNNDLVTFVELLARFPEMQGDQWMAKDNPNLVVWDGLTDAGIDAIQELLTEKRAFFWVVPPSVYVAQGVTLTLPIATRGDYTDRHWMPVALHRRGPTEDELVILARAIIADLDQWRALKTAIKQRLH